MVEWSNILGEVHQETLSSSNLKRKCAFVIHAFCSLHFGTTLCRISVTFVDKDGEEHQLKVPLGMSMLEAAHENDNKLEGKSFGISIVLFYSSPLNLSVRGLTCVFNLPCYSDGMAWKDVEYYNKLEDATDEQNDMLDLAFGLTETWVSFP
ncbi:hypothetical protein RIF29_34481 [Crotalaria pallida]|uniref:Uncharacterized protein n=1 Tax=Crotalaria pallida TaxID=3830 RepID=A0AAN9HUP9_CROPI